MAAALAGLGGCDGGSPARPPAPSTPPLGQPALRAAIPASWASLPEVARSAEAAAHEAEGVAVAAAAWGDAAAGCYLVAMELRGARRDALRVVADKLGWHLDAQAAMHAWQVPERDLNPAEILGKLSVGSLSGGLRALIAFDTRALPRAGLAACFYNEREPATCAAACERLLPQVQVPPLAPRP